MSVLWCITGAGHLLSECVEKIEKLSGETEVTVAFSFAGYEVAVMYGLFGRIKKCAAETVLEKSQGKSSPFVGTLPKKEYEKVVVAPCTANTTAKIAHGIADSLVTNVVAQAGKAMIPVYILPTDAVKDQKTKLPVWINAAVCINCAECKAMRKCPKKAFYRQGRIRIDLMKCMGCRKCVEACKFGAVTFGKEITIHCRDVDLMNAKTLSEIEGIKVIKDLEGLD